MLGLGLSNIMQGSDQVSIVLSFLIQARCKGKVALYIDARCCKGYAAYLSGVKDSDYISESEFPISRYAAWYWIHYDVRAKPSEEVQQ